MGYCELMERSCCSMALNQTVICHLIQRVTDFLLCHYMQNYSPNKGLVEYMTHYGYRNCFILHVSGHRGK